MKLKLPIEDLADEFFDSTRVIGMVAPLKDYQFCWQLNKTLLLDFRINHDIEIRLNKKSRVYFFSVFEFKDQTLSHYLYNNQFDGEYLLPEFRHLDYLWLLRGDDVNDSYLQSLMHEIRALEAVQLVTEIRHDKIRNKAHLIF